MQRSLGQVTKTFCVLTQVQEQVFGILNLLGFKSQSHIQTAWAVRLRALNDAYSLWDGHLAEVSLEIVVLLLCAARGLQLC